MENSRLIQRARAFDHLFDAVVVTDLQGNIIDWNHGSENLYGYSKDEALGQPVSILHVPEDTDHITSDVMDGVQKTGTWNGEVRMLHKDGHIGWIESMVVPLFDDDEQMIGALGINRDISDRIQKEEHLARLAHYDQLTELPNRYLLLDRLKHLIKHAERNKSIFALLYIDLDNFKIINDNEGHASGDKVLKEAAQKLTQSVRESDTVARIGGDEFVVLLETIKDNKDARKLAKVLGEQLSKPWSINNNNYTISGSIGIAIYPKDGITTDELLFYADKAMYQAKNKNKNKSRP